MLTFTYNEKSGLRVSGAGKPLNAFPPKAVKDEINLFSKPEEEAFEHDNVTWPGEYDIAGITIRGIGQLEGQHVSYVVEADGYRIAFPASPLVEWMDADLEKLGEVHVLVLPAEDSKKAVKLMEDIDPRVLIIVPSSDGKMDPEVLKQCGAAGKEQVEEFKLKSTPSDGREVVVLTA